MINVHGEDIRPLAVVKSRLTWNDAVYIVERIIGAQPASRSTSGRPPRAVLLSKKGYRTRTNLRNRIVKHHHRTDEWQQREWKESGRRPNPDAHMIPQVWIDEAVYAIESNKGACTVSEEDIDDLTVIGHARYLPQCARKTFERGEYVPEYARREGTWTRPIKPKGYHPAHRYATEMARLLKNPSPSSREQLKMVVLDKRLQERPAPSPAPSICTDITPAVARRLAVKGTYAEIQEIERAWLRTKAQESTRIGRALKSLLTHRSLYLYTMSNRDRSVKVPLNEPLPPEALEERQIYQSWQGGTEVSEYIKCRIPQTERREALRRDGKRLVESLRAYLRAHAAVCFGTPQRSSTPTKRHR